MEDFDHYGVEVRVGWGMTEMSPLGTVNASMGSREGFGEQAFAKVRLKAGRQIFGVEMKIVDDEGHDLPWDGVAFGSLLVRGPWVCSSYFKLEGSDAHAHEGWFETGDVATIDSQGYMAITDRIKDVIKSGGEWISFHRSGERGNGSSQSGRSRSHWTFSSQVERATLADCGTGVRFTGPHR